MNYSQLIFLIIISTLILVKGNMLGFFIVVLGYVFYCLFSGNKVRIKWTLLILICIFTRYVLINDNDVELVEHDVGYIVSIRDFGYIVRDFDSVNNYILYTDEVLGINDVIEFKQTPKHIDSFQNFYIFNYLTYAKQNHIVASYDNPSIKLLYKSKVAGKLSRLIKQSDNELLKKFIFKEGEESYDYESTFLSSGMHFSFLFNFLATTLGFFFYEKHCQHIISLFKIICFGAFPHLFALKRIILMDILKYFKFDYQIRILIYLCFFLIIDPFNIVSYSFLIPLLFMLSSLYKGNTEEYIMNIVTIIPIQLLMNNSISLLFLLLFNVLKVIYSWLFIFSLLNNTFLNNILMKLYNIVIYLYSIIIELDLRIGVGYASILFCVVYYLVVFESKYMLRSAGILVLINYLLLYSIPFTRITMIDVGQGDSILIEYPFHRANILVDTGGSRYRDIANDVLIPILYSKGINKLDYLFVTHDDMDHSGAKEQLIKNFRIDNIIDSNNNQIFKIDRINQIKQYDVGDYDDENANSLILSFIFDDISFFTAGDITSSVESKLLRMNLLEECDIYKLSHHGSDTSNTKKFIGYLKPKIIVNSSGRNNYYNHPAESVIKTINDLDIPYYDTQKDGAIEIIIVSNFIAIRTMKRNIYGIMKA